MKDFKYTIEELWKRRNFFLQLCHETGNESNWNYDQTSHIFDCLGQLPFDQEHDQERAALYQKLEKSSEELRKIAQKRKVFWAEIHNIDIVFGHLKWQETYLADERRKEQIKLTQNMNFMDRLKFVLK